MPFFELVIFADGRASACCIFYKRSKEDNSDNNVVDNILNKNLNEIWWGRNFDNLRKKMITSQPPEKCLSCPPDTKYRHKTWEDYLSGHKIRYL
jgi:hypothetical protein